MKKQYVATIGNLECEVALLFNETPCVLAIYDTLKRASLNIATPISYAKCISLAKDLKTVPLEAALRDIGGSVKYGDTVIMMAEAFYFEDDE